MRRRFVSRRLVVVAPAEAFRRAGEREPGFGDTVRLNSGGPVMLVVDAEPGGALTLAWEGDGGAVQEALLPSACVHPACA